MAWIKRNLVLVISGAIAFALFAAGGYYLFSALQKDKQISEEIERTKSEIQALLAKPVTPTAENLKAARQEAVKLNSFVAEARRLFPPTPPPAEPLNPLSFKSHLARTVNELHQQAISVGIKLESNYYFTFESQRLPVAFPPESLRPLSERLHEVHFIADVLMKSRINRLVGMKRAMVVSERPTGGGNQPGGTDYLASPARTNAETGMTAWPYEVVFDCFTPEFASVLDGMQRANGFIVKTVEVKPADGSASLTGEPRRPGRPVRSPDAAQPPRRPAVPGRNPPGAPPVRPAAPGAPPAPPRGALETIINEKLLRVTMRIDVVKPDAPSAGGPRPGGGRRGGNP